MQQSFIEMTDQELFKCVHNVELAFRLMGKFLWDYCPYCGNLELVHDCAGPLDTPAAVVHFKSCQLCGAYPVTADDADNASILENYTGWVRPQL